MTAPTSDQPVKSKHQGRYQSRAFQQAVSLCLRDAGIADARPSRRLTVNVPGPVTPEDNGDIVGIPGWSVVARVRSRDSVAPSGVLDIATQAARDSGTPYAAAIIARPGRPAEGAYALLSLEDFAEIVARLDGLPVALLRSRRG